MSHYSIIIPIHNELELLPLLIKDVNPYALKGHEIIVIDDGSTDKSTQFLKNFDYINLITLKTNKGKGVALRKGLEKASNNKIIILDGDNEIPLSVLNQFMILDSNSGVLSVFGTRYINLNPLKSLMDCGNFLFTILFNFLHNSKHQDILCCAKSFYKNDLNLKALYSTKFSIDVEIASMLTQKLGEIHTINLPYQRRTISEGKKLRLWDGISILILLLKRILN